MTSQLDFHLAHKQESDQTVQQFHPPSPPSPKPISAVQRGSSDLSLLDIVSQHQPAGHTAFATLATSLGLAKQSLLAKSWASKSLHLNQQSQQKPFLDSNQPSSTTATTHNSFNSESEDDQHLAPNKSILTPPSSLPPSSGFYHLLSRSSSVVGQGILNSLVRRGSQLDEPLSTTANITENDDDIDDSEETDFMFEAPPLEPVRLTGFSPTTRTRLLKPSIAEEIRTFVPARVQLHDTWTLVYSLEQHGASLSTLFSNNTPKHDTHPTFVLIIRDRIGSIFGAYVNEHFRPSEFKRFYGNGDCFLWKYETSSKPSTPIPTEAGSSTPRSRSATPVVGAGARFHAFPYTGVNDFVMFSTHSFLSLGGGNGHYGLWVDANLEHGVSSHSLTFDNEPLSDSGIKFDIVGLEVWRIG